jgi:hypothetical protein
MQGDDKLRDGDSSLDEFKVSVKGHQKSVKNGRGLIHIIPAPAEGREQACGYAPRCSPPRGSLGPPNPCDTNLALSIRFFPIIG